MVNLTGTLGFPEGSQSKRERNLKWKRIPRAGFEDGSGHVGGFCANFSTGDVKKHPFIQDKASIKDQSKDSTQVWFSEPISLLSMHGEHWWGGG